MDADSVSDAQQLRVAISRVARRMRQVYTEHDDTGPSFTEVAVLHRLERDGPQSTTDIAGRERVTSQAITAVIRELKMQGFVSQQPDAVDRRRSLIEITSTGRKVLGEREDSVMQSLARVLAEECTPSERRQLPVMTRVLNRIADSL